MKIVRWVIAVIIMCSVVFLVGVALDIRKAVREERDIAKRQEMQEIEDRKEAERAATQMRWALERAQHAETKKRIEKRNEDRKRRDFWESPEGKETTKLYEERRRLGNWAEPDVEFDGKVLELLKRYEARKER
ncbi:MAG: hypothetical protein KAX19_05730 [Candidatus Brocadiae bacterium]|nr:hypothetical protein [Candidatus Brocadiia bacterium]